MEVKKNKKKGFTLVELLAVIVILAIILVIAVPKVMSVIEDAKKATLESTAKMIASQAEKQKVQNTVLGNDKKITCKDITNINDVDYASCEITFDNNTAKVTITGGGKFEGLNVCGGTKTSATATDEKCKPTPPVVNCTYDGELVQGAEFVHNQYTYRYKQEYKWDDEWNYLEWRNIEQDGWGVILTDKSSTEPVNTSICTYINGKPLVSTSHMFYKSAATSLDISNWNTSNVTNMSGMFYGSDATSLDLSSFDTSNVTKMNEMFSFSAATELDLSSFDTSNVTDMSCMFCVSAATELDLSSFNTSNVTNMFGMFLRSAARTIYVGDNWNTYNVISYNDMFRDATNLVGGNGTTYNASYTDKTYARIDTASTPGYFTYKASN